MLSSLQRNDGASNNEGHHASILIHTNVSPSHSYAENQSTLHQESSAIKENMCANRRM